MVKVKVRMPVLSMGQVNGPEEVGLNPNTKPKLASWP